jgi:citrate lyase beta subunit
VTRSSQVHELELIALELDQLLAVADAELETSYAGSWARRQPVHTAYVPAHRFAPDTVLQWGAQAAAAVQEFLPGLAEFAAATCLDPEMAAVVRPLVLSKLATQPIEDLRIDFEDGYGARGDDTEDAHARAAARSLSDLLRHDSAPPFVGLRCKSLEKDTRRRAARTLQAFLATLMESDRPLPPGFVITLPKVTSAAQVSAMAVLCERLEQAFSASQPAGLAFEIQVETPQVILGADGAATIAKCVHAAPRRLIGLHYGTYDYSAALGIAGPYQSMEHPAADLAKQIMQIAVAGTGVRLSDGSTNVLPVGGRDEVIAAWQLHSRLVRRSLERGFYQGWDLHPAQLISRYAATYAFFREWLGTAAGRLRTCAERSATGQEEPATIRALADFLSRAIECGAIEENELSELTNLTNHQIRVARRSGVIPNREL